MKIQDLLKRFKKCEEIKKGWSQDKKYFVIQNEKKYFLRIGELSRREKLEFLFLTSKKLEVLGIPTPASIEFGVCEDGVYLIQSFTSGKDFREKITFLTKSEQYNFGVKAGEILKKIHSLPAPEEQENWATFFNNKINIKIKKYLEYGLRFDGDERFISYIEQNRRLLNDRPQCFQHGDYHIGNMTLEEQKLLVIDFDRFSFGDAWEDFRPIVWSAEKSAFFASGQLHGYFNGEPTEEFFKTLALYLALNSLVSVYWALPFGSSEVETMLKQAKEVLNWFDNMQNHIPVWYQKTFS